MSDRVFAVIIPTYKRASRQTTTRTLRNQGYTGEIYYLIDENDPERSLYEELYGENVVVFSKQEVCKTCDTLDNFGKMNIVLYSRNTAFSVAKSLGLTHFLVLDDDYTKFRFNKVLGKNQLKVTNVKNLDRVFECYLDFLDCADISTVCMGQGGDFIGGSSTLVAKGITRKAMNSFFCRVDRPFKYKGTTNEDVNAYVSLGSRGKLFFTIFTVSLDQGITQKNSGGLTDIYLDQGTYVKSFYSVIVQPSSVKVHLMGQASYRLHHQVDWNKTVPKIIKEDYKK